MERARAEHVVISSSLFPGDWATNTGNSFGREGVSGVHFQEFHIQDFYRNPQNRRSLIEFVGKIINESRQ
jgi:hypothetical protein